MRAPRRILSVLFWLPVATFGAPVFAAPQAPAAATPSKFDSSSVGKGSDEAPAPKPKVESKPKKTSGKEYAGSIPRTSRETEKELQDSIKAFNTLLKGTPEGPARDTLLLNRAKAFYSLAQSQILRAKAGATPEATKKILRYVINEATIIGRNVRNKREDRFKALYLAGTAHIYLDDTKGAVSYFREAIPLVPPTAESQWMTFYIAESEFEEGHHAEALKLYQNYLTGYDRSLAPLAYYKIAWCFINLEKTGDAEKWFIKLIKDFPQQDIAKDSRRDLAFIVTKHMTELEILSLMDGLFKDPEAKLDFLRAVQSNLEIQGVSKPESVVLSRLLDMETDVVRKLQLLLTSLRTQRRDYASKDHLRAFVRVKKTLDAEKISPRSKEFEAVSATLDAETQKLIRSFVETFAERVKAPDNIPKPELASALKALFVFYARSFPKSTLRPVIFGLWLDVCGDVKDWVCLNQVGTLALVEPNLGPTGVRAELERLAALEELVKLEPNKPEYAKEFLEALTRYVKNWEGKSTQWPSITRRLAALHMKDKRYDDAITHLSRLVDVEPKADNYYLLQRARFEGGEYKEVLAETRGAKMPPPPHPDLEELLRESALKLAAKAREEKRGEDYIKYIKSFFAHNPDPVKLKVAKKDYLAYLVETGAVSEAHRELASFPEAARFGADYGDDTERLAFLHLRRGEFAEAVQMVGGVANLPKLPPRFQYPGLLGQVASNQAPDRALVASLPAEKKDYFLGLLVIVQPATLTAFYDQYPPQNEAARGMYLTALRFAKNDWNFAGNAKETTALGNQLPLKQRAFPPSPYEQKLEKIVFPATTLSPAAFTKKFQVLVADTRTLRGSLMKDVQGKPPFYQQHLFKAAAAHERKVADTILKSPVPTGLTKEQVQEYSQGLIKLSSEFTDQASEFEKLQNSSAEVLRKEQSDESLRYLPRPDMRKWPWPSKLRRGTEEFVSLAALIKSGNFTGGLVVADLLRDSALKADEDYFRVRSGVLLSLRNSEVMRRYVYEELAASKREDIIEQWKELVRDELPKPAPAPAPAAAVAPAAAKASAPAAQALAPAAPPVTAPPPGGSP